MTGRSVPTGLGELFGEEMRIARKAAGLTQGELAAKVFCVPTMISMLETAQRTPKPDLVERIDAELGCLGRLIRLHALADNQAIPGWALELADAERAATSIRSFQPSFPPGLLQTPQYAEAVFGWARYLGVPDDEISRRVARRLKRQEVLRAGKLRSYWVIIHESVLHSVIGGTAVLRDQLGYLLSVVEERIANIQVLPYEAGAFPGLAGPISLLDVEPDGLLVHLEGPLDGRTTSDAGTIRQCTDRYDVLRSQAASVADSLTMIAARMEEL